MPSRYSQEGVLPGFTKNCTNEDLIDLETEVSGKKLKTKITEEDVKEIALKEVSGKVTDVAIEKKFDKPTYVVEIKTKSGEIDVIIDIDTGKILGIEE